jgi:hypothetical protein
MGLEWHGTTGPYYYRKRREAGRVSSDYVGSGPVAQLIAAYDAAERLEQQRRRAAFRALVRAAEERATLLLATEADVRALSAGCLIVNGFYTHKRQWRRRADMETKTQLRTIDTADVVPLDAAARRKEGMQRFRQALKFTAEPTQGGRKPTKRQEAAAELHRRTSVRQVLRDYPEIWTELRNALTSAEKRLIDTATEDVLARDILLTAMTGMRRDLGHVTAPLLEQLLIEQIVLCWADLDLTWQRLLANTADNHTRASGLYWNPSGRQRAGAAAACDRGPGPHSAPSDASAAAGQHRWAAGQCRRDRADDWIISG